MVTRINCKIVYLLIVVVAIIPFQGAHALSPSIVSANGIQYHIDKEWAVVWINTDGSIELHYNITITYETSALGYITIGMPAKGFTVFSAEDLSGTDLSYTDVSSGNNYAVEVYFGHPMSPGSRDTVLLVATVPNMFSPDDMNPGYLGMQFMPTYFSDASVDNLRVAIVPPKDVPTSDIKTSETAHFTTVDGEFALFWERNDLAPNTQLIFGVSIPEAYITLPGPDIWFYLTIALIIVAVMAVFIIVVRRLRKAVYERPKISVEALGVARGLTAVEAGMVVGLKPVKVLTMILFGMLRKRFIMIKETDPIIKVERLDAVKGETAGQPLRYYEIDFLKAVEADGTLDERGLARAYLSLRGNVDRRIRGYSRVDTANYYKSVTNDAWGQVTQAGTPQLKEDAIAKNIEWLLMDEDYNDKFKRVFPPGVIITPRPGWYWYWYGPYSPKIPGGAVPSTAAEVKPIPAQEWANNVVEGLEKMTNNVVKNVEEFTNRLLPRSAAQSSRPVRQGSNCVCACAHCACACACVGCACACAGGGAR